MIVLMLFEDGSQCNGDLNRMCLW